MIDYTKIIEILINISSILFALGIASKIRILVAPIKVRLLICMTNFMEETLNNDHNKNIIDTYLEKEFDLKKDENGEHNYTLKQIEKAIKVNEKTLKVDEDKYMGFVLHTAIINTLNWFSKNGIKLAFKVIFVCICIVAGQASLDAYHSMK